MTDAESGTSAPEGSGGSTSGAAGPTDDGPTTGGDGTGGDGSTPRTVEGEVDGAAETGGDAPEDGATGPPESGATGTGPRGRDVEVPFEVYKTVTVFSTLFAVGAVVLGFVLLDWGTDRATADLSDVNVAITLAGLACIALGAGTYAFSTRFRARGMGNAKDGAD